MDGTSMVIEVLGRLIIEKDEEIQRLQKTIDDLNKKIRIFTQYMEVYEECLKREEQK